MALVTSGLMNKQVAAKTGLAEPTVKMHRGQIMRKMGAKSVADLVKMAEILEVHGNSFRHPPRMNSRSHPAPVRRTLVLGKPPTDRSEILPRRIRDTQCRQRRS